MNALEIWQIIARPVEEVLARRPVPIAVTLKQAALRKIVEEVKS